MLDVLKRNSNMYPILAKKTLSMSIGTLEKPAAVTHKRLASSVKPIVKAGTVLGQNSSTEIIDVSGLSQKSSSLIQYVEVTDIAGQLYSVNRHINTSCWLKIISFAKDCQSCNVVLMTTDKGIVLKTIRNITAGEPLLMWFTEHVLALLNMPYLTNLNIQGQNRYVCHVCNNHFEHPNPLKIHLALKCNRLDSNYLWMQLAKEFNSTPRPTLSFSLFQNLPSFHFKYSEPPLTSPKSVSPVLTEMLTFHSLNIQNNLNNEDISQPFSNHPTPTSFLHDSAPTYYQSSSTTQVSLTKKNYGQRHSAFKPYINQTNSYLTKAVPSHVNSPATQFQMKSVPNTTHIQGDSQAAQMEIIVSNLGKSKQGHLCIYCGKVYSRKYGLKIHIRTHTGYKPLKCKYCLRPFGDPSNLNKHVRLHADGDTPYRCDLCGKILVRRRDLERHIRSRHQDNDHISDFSSDGIDI